MSGDIDVLIIGAGLSGLSAGIHLQKDGLKVQIIEASDRAGGRVKTDKVNGFLLDRGFQVLLTAYPEAQAMLDYDALHLKHFSPGATIYYQKKFHTMADPFRKPMEGLGGVFSPLSNIGDKMKVLALKNRTKRLTIEEIFQEKEKPTRAYLKEWSFSPKMVRSFFKPFLGGIFLDPTLQTSSRFFEFVFKMFGTGYAAIPSSGMEAIPKQLLNQLDPGTVVYNERATKVEQGRVETVNGNVYTPKMVLLAVEAPALEVLVGYEGPTAMNGTSTLYFAMEEAPLKKDFLLLNGTGRGLVNSIAVLTNIQEDYSSDNRALISVSVVKPHEFNKEELLLEVRDELVALFGEEAERWLHLKSYNIINALPEMTEVDYPSQNDVKAYAPGIFICGDHTHDPSINGALRSGRLVADAISWKLALAKRD